MGTSDVKAIIEQVEQLLAEEELSERAEFAIHNLLNVVEALSADKKSLADEVERLRKQLEQKKKSKNTSSKDDKAPPSDDDSTSSDHSSEKRRKSGKKPKANDRLLGALAVCLLGRSLLRLLVDLIHSRVRLDFQKTPVRWS